MNLDPCKEKQYWFNVFQRELLFPRSRDLFILEAVCYHPYPLIFKRILNFFEHYQLKKILSVHKIEIYNKKVLDIGCGGGRFSYFFANRGGKVTAVDFAENVIHRNREIFPYIRFEQMDSCYLKFQDEQFDFVNAFITLQHITKNRKILALKEMVRVLKPLGYMFILESHPHKNQMQNENRETLTHEEWKKIFLEFNLTVIESYHLHFFPLYELYKYLNQLAYECIKSIKSVFYLADKEYKQKTQTDLKDLDDQKKSFRHKIYDIIERNSLRVVACISFPLEFMFISNFIKNFLKGSHTMYLVQKIEA